MHNQLPQKTEMSDVVGNATSGYNSTVAITVGNEAIDHSVPAKAKSLKQFDVGGPDDHQCVPNDSNIMLNNSLKATFDQGIN